MRAEILCAAIFAFCPLSSDSAHASGELPAFSASSSPESAAGAHRKKLFSAVSHPDDDPTDRTVPPDGREPSRGVRRVLTVIPGDAKKGTHSRWEIVEFVEAP